MLLAIVGYQIRMLFEIEYACNCVRNLDGVVVRRNLKITLIAWYCRWVEIGNEILIRFKSWLR